jgi:superfamily I DNA and RNA helicase
MYRAKGHEAPMVYILGLEFVAQDEGNIKLRNQLFVALTRSMAWVHLSGITDPDTHSDYLLYDEVRNVIRSGDTIKFIYQKPPKRNLADDE